MKHNTFRFRKLFFRFLSGVLPAFVLVSPLLALEPPTPEQLQRYRADGSLGRRIEDARALGNHLAAPALIHRLQQKLDPMAKSMAAPPEPLWGLPSSGTVKVLTLLIAFSDYAPAAANTQASIHAKLFADGSGGYPQESLRNYYQRSSYNQLQIQGNTLGWYTTAYARGTVPETTAGREDLIKEALNYYNALGHDFTQYDNDGDGEIDYFVVIWTGPPGDWATFWWGYFTGFSGWSYTIDGKHLGSYSWQWESGSTPPAAYSPTVVIHETGHALGLPDYYDYDPDLGPPGGVGDLDMMDGNWGDHNCFSKFLLGWLTPTTYSTGLNAVSLHPSSGTTDALLFMPEAVPGNEFGEFYMAQNRDQSGNDTGYPGSGVLVWHVDSRTDGYGNFLYDNSYSEHKLLRLMEADGLEEIEQGLGADAGDYWPAGGMFGPVTTPSSYRYDGSNTGSGIRNISAGTGVLNVTHYNYSDDLTPPAGTPTAPVDEGAATASSVIQFAWTPGSSADPQSGIDGYRLQIGTFPGGNDIGERNVARMSTASVADCESGFSFFARVAALNGGGLAGGWSGNSDGILVTAPVIAGSVIENPELALTTTSAAPWTSQGSVVYSGASAARSGAIGNGQATSIYVSVTGPGTLDFFWKVSSEDGWDILNFTMDGTGDARGISGEEDWTLFSMPVPTGRHMLKWTYTKDSVCCTGGSDAGWLDALTYNREVKGNLNGSPKINGADLAILIHHLAGHLNSGTPPFTAPASYADVDSSGGSADAADLSILANYLAGNNSIIP